MQTPSSVQTSPAPEPRRVSFSLKDFVIKFGLLVILAVMIVVFWRLEPAFGSARNMFSILQAVSVTALLALGVTVTLAIGGFDLSIGSTAAMSLMASSYVMVILDLGTLPAIAVCLFLGLAIGFANGMLIVKGRIPDLLATLGMMFLLLGLQLIPTGGRSIAKGMTLPSGGSAQGSFTETFLALGRYRVFDLIPLPVIVMIVAAILLWVFMERSRYGRVLYAIGGNEKATRLAGAPVERYKIAAYMISGGFASVGGMLLAARVGRGDVSSGSSLLLDSVAAALIGFAVLGAKKPNVFGTAIGALFVGTLLNGLTMLNAPYYAQDFVKGLVLVLALLFTFGFASSNHR
ncbi:ABC transporter permease [Siculibacillus lacustris]|uniref:ABC transporter permease n=1 Tax=Siculibacillus lacustris TaxID=1549641 RepID=A0A4Q9VNA7_9HYPH|nr:ABC transporter permease [Siculibacillus lacustris]TBW36269.1 ABC transporter permease [Siculibacillus lacustris]